MWAAITKRTAEGGPRGALRSSGRRSHMTGASGPAWSRGSQRRREDSEREARDRSARERQAGENIGWEITGYLLGGMLFYGGAGWLIGRWAGHQSALMAVGVIVGVALALTLTILRHGRA